MTMVNRQYHETPRAASGYAGKKKGPAKTGPFARHSVLIGNCVGDHSIDIADDSSSRVYYGT